MTKVCSQVLIQIIEYMSDDMLMTCKSVDKKWRDATKSVSHAREKAYAMRAFKMLYFFRPRDDFKWCQIVDCCKKMKPDWLQKIADLARDLSKLVRISGSSLRMGTPQPIASERPCDILFSTILRCAGVDVSPKDIHASPNFTSAETLEILKKYKTDLDQLHKKRKYATQSQRLINQQKKRRNNEGCSPSTK